jgi:peptidoglycan/xylan/chitin deacetylase (PgdA/CDA1 family)
MPAFLSKLTDRAAETMAVRTGWAKRRFRSSVGEFRVLAYHGLVPDELAERAWVPSHYVTVSQFERQMALLSDLGVGTVRSLGEAAVCLTFDDGAADNVTLALPILQRCGFVASFFLTTGYIDGDRLLPNDRIRLLRQACRAGRLRGPVSPFMQMILDRPGCQKQHVSSLVVAEVESLWTANLEQVDGAAIETLRMMSWSEAGRLCDAGMEIGAHTVNHVILGREDQETRFREISESVAEVSTRLGVDRVPFSYPNGLAGDFGPEDVSCLQVLDVPYAVTELPGCNAPDTSRLGLRRHCVGLHTSDDVFLAQVCGLRDGRPLVSEQTIG